MVAITIFVIVIVMTVTVIVLVQQSSSRYLIPLIVMRDRSTIVQG
jgi:preprotein translocase subunit SecG